MRIISWGKHDRLYYGFLVAIFAFSLRGFTDQSDAVWIAICAVVLALVWLIRLKDAE